MIIAIEKIEGQKTFYKLSIYKTVKDLNDNDVTVVEKEEIHNLEDVQERISYFQEIEQAIQAFDNQA